MTHTSTSRARRALILAAVFAFGSAGSVTLARADDGQAPVAQPPSVARISIVTGDVGVKHGDTDQVSAAVNAPLEAGDYVSTGSDGRVEVQLDPGNVVRASSDTQIRFTQLDGAADTVQLAQGTVELRVLQGDADHVSLQTPSVDVVPDEAGAYLVTVDSDGQTFVTARSGSVDVNTPKGSQTLDPGKTMQVTGKADDPQYQFVDAVAATDFDAWADGRDQQLTVATTDAQNVNPNVLGVPDLDQYGQWTNVSGYGEVWQPNDVPSNWTPYSDGTWAYENYYGWTWVAAEPWGWAPYHYGSWVSLDSGWAWVPGQPDVAPVYSPARVAFFGYGGGGGSTINVGVSLGNVGWVPLAPGEAARPWWGANRGGFASFNASRYQNIGRGLVGVTVAGWQHGNFGHIARLNPSQFGGLRAATGRLPFNPTNANYRFINRPVGATVPKPVYQRFNAIRQVPAVHGPSTNGWQHFNAATRSYQPAYRQPQANQRQSFARQSYQQPYQRQSYQRQSYQPQAYQRPSYQRQSYQGQSSQRQSYRPQSYQRQSYQRPMQQRAPVSRGSGGRPRPHGPGKP